MLFWKFEYSSFYFFESNLQKNEWNSAFGRFEKTMTTVSFDEIASFVPQSQ